MSRRKIPALLVLIILSPFSRIPVVRRAAGRILFWWLAEDIVREALRRWK